MMKRPRKERMMSTYLLLGTSIMMYLIGRSRSRLSPLFRMALAKMMKLSLLLMH
jgi:hypothetical protein